MPRLDGGCYSIKMIYSFLQIRIRLEKCFLPNLCDLEYAPLPTAICKSNRQMYVGQIYSVLSSLRPSLLTHLFTESSRRLLAFNYTHLLKVIPHGIQTPKTPKHKQSALSLWATCYGVLGVLSVYAYFRVFIRKRRAKAVPAAAFTFVAVAAVSGARVADISLRFCASLLYLRVCAPEMLVLCAVARTPAMARVLWSCGRREGKTRWCWSFLWAFTILFLHNIRYILQNTEFDFIGTQTQTCALCAGWLDWVPVVNALALAGTE